MSNSTETIREHWRGAVQEKELGRRILDALVAAGKDIDRLLPDDLAAVDEFHIRGREGSEELVALAGIRKEMRVLDVGCGIGGPSRYLARTVGCRVSGIDLTDEYCEVARMLAARTGVDALVDYRQGDALDLPFEDSSFDLVWTQHASMNIDDKTRFWAELHRVLEPGGKLAYYDPIAGSGDALELPVPWARTPEMSVLLDAAATREVATAAGFEIVEWRDVTEAAVEWFEAAAARPAGAGTPAVGLHLLLGEDWPTMAGNMRANIEAGRISVVQAIMRRPV
jgi:SAM-dependent methyltransferase